MAVHQGCPQYYRPASDLALLCLIGTFGIQQKHRTVSQRAQNHTNLPHHEDPENPKVGPALYRAPIPGLHSTAQLQGAGTTHDVLSHWYPHVLQFGLLCREGAGGYRLYQYSRDILVGCHHHDYSGVWRHLPQDSTRQVRRKRVLYMRGACYCSTYSHHCQQLCRVLQGPDAAREGSQEEGGHGEGEKRR